MPKQEESKIKEETTTKTNHIEIELPPLKRLNSSEKLIQDEHTKKFEEIFSKEQKNESLDNSMMDFTVKRK